jgi:hypothetical protein
MAYFHMICPEYVQLPISEGSRSSGRRRECGLTVADLHLQWFTIDGMGSKGIKIIQKKLKI